MKMWLRVEGQCRCQNCGRMTDVTWRWYSAPARWTIAYCERCVDVLLGNTPA